MELKDMDQDETSRSKDVPEVLFPANSATPQAIAIPELLEWSLTESVRMLEPIGASVPAFIFPGIILTMPHDAIYIPASDLTLLEGERAGEGAVRFTSVGIVHTLTAEQIAGFGHTVDVRLREPLPRGGDAVVCDGCLLRDTGERLYYLPSGVFGTFTSFAEATSVTR
jgi:hypothetical protein